MSSFHAVKHIFLRQAALAVVESQIPKSKASLSQDFGRFNWNPRISDPYNGGDPHALVTHNQDIHAGQRHADMERERDKAGMEEVQVLVARA